MKKLLCAYDLSKNERILDRFGAVSMAKDMNIPG